MKRNNSRIYAPHDLATGGLPFVSEDEISDAMAYLENGATSITTTTFIPVKGQTRIVHFSDRGLPAPHPQYPDYTEDF